MKATSLNINQVLLTPILLTVVLYFGRPILIPLCFAILLAMLMAPVCRFFDKKGLIRALSCTICILILLVSFLLLIGIVIMQLSDFLENMNEINQQLSEIWISFKQQIETWFNISPRQQDIMMKKQIQEMKDSSTLRFDKIAGDITSVFVGLAIVLVFTFLLLYHKEKYEHFFLKLYPEENTQEVKEVLGQITHVSQQYLVGRILSMIFLFVLYSISLLLIGIENALLLSAIASLLTIIPYIGPILGGFFPLMTAILTENSIQPAIWVLVSLIIIQAIDNYFVEPNVIGGEVRVTALSTILAIFIGGILWGIAGMILFIPILGILKIIFNHVEKLKPYGYLIGDEGKSPSSRIKAWFGRKR
ncbi:MAG: AI-2E family transporter [Flavitalea sp.]